MPSFSPVIERARPLLGTIVAIRVGGQSAARAHAAIDAAFARIARIHARMSFQDGESDVSRLNQAWPGERLRVDPETYAVLDRARVIARASRGVFDPTIAGDLVGRGRLPAPREARPPDPSARWDDLILEGRGEVSLRRPVWIDLSGIAKGHAVDRAVAALAEAGVTEACVEAGGDLRVLGAAQRVALRTGFPDEAVAVVEIADGSLASSGGRADPRRAADDQHGDGLGRGPIPPGRFASVVARDCAVADALTKVVLALGPASGTVLRRFGAAAHLREPDGAWRAVGDAA